MKKKEQKYYCPICGKLDDVREHSITFKEWECTKCSIIFKWEKVPPSRKMGSTNPKNYNEPLITKITNATIVDKKNKNK